MAILPTATVSTGAGTLVTGLTQGGGANNYWEAGYNGSNDTFAGAVIKNITSNTLGVTETNGTGTNNAVATVGVVFQPTVPLSLGALPAATALTVASGGTLDLGGISQTVASLSDLTAGNGGVIQSSGGAATLTLSATTGSTTSSAA